MNAFPNIFRVKGRAKSVQIKENLVGKIDDSSHQNGNYGHVICNYAHNIVNHSHKKGNYFQLIGNGAYTIGSYAY